MQMSKTENCLAESEKKLADFFICCHENQLYPITSQIKSKGVDLGQHLRKIKSLLSSYLVTIATAFCHKKLLLLEMNLQK